MLTCQVLFLCTSTQGPNDTQIRALPGPPVLILQCTYAIIQNWQQSHEWCGHAGLWSSFV